MSPNHNWKKDIVLFILSQTLSLFGSSLVQYAIMWHITLDTKSGTMMTIFIICGLLPTLFLSPFSGVWADRYNRKKIIILADGFIAIATLILAILFLNGYNSIWLLFTMSAVRALGSGIHSPAINAILPQIAPADKLTRVNAINGSIQSMVFLIAPMIAASLMNYVSIEKIFFIDVFTAAFAILILSLFINIPTHERSLKADELTYLEDFKMGLSYIKNNSYLKQFFLFCMIFFFLISPLAFLTPLQVTRSYGDDVWRLSALEIGFSIGMMVGGALMAYWGGFKNKIHTMALSTLATGIGTFILGLAPHFYIYLIMMGFLGLTMPLFNTPSTVLLQQKIAPDYLGRVFGIFSMIHSSMMPLGMLLFGPLSDVLKIEWLLMITGFMMLFMCIFLVKSKAMLEAGKE